MKLVVLVSFDAEAEAGTYLRVKMGETSNQHKLRDIEFLIVLKGYMSLGGMC
jgi:hypothetical protein